MTVIKNTTHPTDKSFGHFFSAIFFLLGTLIFYKDGATVSLLSSCLFIAGTVLWLISIIAPKLLRNFKILWLKFGELSGRIVSPLVLSLLYLLLIIPTGIIGTLLGRDELRLKKRKTSSYWIDRNPPGPDGDSFKNQF